MFKKNISEKDISKITKCDTHKKIGTSTDGKYDYYISSKSGTKDDFLGEFNKTEFEIIDKKIVRKMVLFYQKKLIWKTQRQ